MKQIKKTFIKYKEKIIFIRNFILYSVAYGIPINYMLWGIFGIKFGIFTFPAYGVLFYILQEELPRMWRRFFSSR